MSQKKGGKCVFPGKKSVQSVQFEKISVQSVQSVHFGHPETKVKNKCFVVLQCTVKGLQKSISELER